MAVFWYNVATAFMFERVPIDTFARPLKACEASLELFVTIRIFVSKLVIESETEDSAFNEPKVATVTAMALAKFLIEDVASFELFSIPITAWRIFAMSSLAFAESETVSTTIAIWISFSI
jgi:hypothetical protein